MGQTFLKIAKLLEEKIFDFLSSFSEKQRSRPDHPELNPPTQSSKNAKTKQNQATTINNAETVALPIEVSPVDHEHSNIDTNQTAIPIMSVPVTNEVKSSEDCSDFYLACRNNNVNEVKKLLKTLTPDEINRLEPNGSTGLHAACYHGHVEIVRLLLEQKVDRSIQNKFGFLPFDEAANNNIRELFLRMPNENRLRVETGGVEWEMVDSDVTDTTMEERKLIKFIYESTPVNQMFDKIEKNYIKTGLANTSRIENILDFFRKATELQDPIWIIKAYTAETDFYNVLNAEIAGGANKYTVERRYIIALLSHHPALDPWSYTGTSYRVMKITDYELEKYQVNSISMNKSFLSSSKDEEIAAFFLSRQEAEQETSKKMQRYNKDGKLMKSWVMCKYHIKCSRTALNIRNISQYTVENEILIMPFSLFKVKSKELVERSYLTDKLKVNVIEFEEYDQYIG